MKEATASRGSRTVITAGSREFADERANPSIGLWTFATIRSRPDNLPRQVGLGTRDGRRQTQTPCERQILPHQIDIQVNRSRGGRSTRRRTAWRAGPRRKAPPGSRQGGQPSLFSSSPRFPRLRAEHRPIRGPASGYPPVAGQFHSLDIRRATRAPVAGKHVRKPPGSERPRTNRNLGKGFMMNPDEFRGSVPRARRGKSRTKPPAVSAGVLTRPAADGQRVERLITLSSLGGLRTRRRAGPLPVRPSASPPSEPAAAHRLEQEHGCEGSGACSTKLRTRRPGPPRPTTTFRRPLRKPLKYARYSGDGRARPMRPVWK